MTKKLKFRYGQNLEAPSQNFGLVFDQKCRTVENLEFFISDSRDKSKKTPSNIQTEFRISNDSSFSHFPTVD